MHDINFLQHYDFKKVKIYLANNKYKTVTNFEMKCKDEYWSNASILLIPKKEAPEAIEAIIYLIQNLVISTNSDLFTDIYTEYELAALYEDMIQIFVRENLENINIRHAFKEIKDILDRINEIGDADIQKDGFKLDDFNQIYAKIDESKLLAASSIINEWNEKRYFIESKDCWLYFEWASSV